MKIETKFDIGQEVWCVSYNPKCVIHNKVECIYIEIIQDIQVSYILCKAGIGRIYVQDEKMIFATKEEAEQKLKEINNDTDEHDV